MGQQGLSFYLLLLCAGGFGSIMRYQVSLMTIKLGVAGLPLATLIVNSLGSFFMGLLAYYFSSKSDLSTATQAILLAGLLGGFTTFSAFSLETIRLFEQMSWERALAAAAVSVTVPIMACLLGLVSAKRLFA